MFKHALVCLLLFTGRGVCVGQQADVKSDLRGQSHATDALTQVAEQIKALDEPAFRVLLRSRLAKYLWANKSAEMSKAAEAIAEGAIIDLQARHKEIPKSYADLFRRELIATLQVNAPALAERLIKTHDLDNNANRADTAFELLGSRDGTQKAVELIRHGIRTGQQNFDPRLIFIFGRLDETQPAETNKLMAELMSQMEARPDGFPVTSLFTLAHSYLYREATPAPLKARFLALLIRASSNPAALAEGERTQAYTLLKINLPAVERLLPALYPQAGAQLAALVSLQPREAVERGEAYDNIRKNSGSVEQLVGEAKKTRDAAFRRELLTRAAQLALDKGELKSAADLIVEANDKNGEPFIPHQDQFLAQVAQKALGKKDAEMAAYAAARIDDQLKRASATQRLALYFYETQDLPRALEVMGDAVKLIEGADDGARKAVSILSAVNAALRMDALRAAALADSAVKAVNNLPGRRPDDIPGSEGHLTHVEAMIDVAHYLIPVFDRLAQRDEGGTVGLAGRLRQRELKAAALFGVATGTDAAARKKPAAAPSK